MSQKPSDSSMDQIPSENIFMICMSVDPHTLTNLPTGFKFRLCRPDELDQWKAIHFDEYPLRNEYQSFIDDFFERVYGQDKHLFFQKCVFACDVKNRPVGTVFLWEAYGKINTVHWWKVKKQFEGQGIGRALLSRVLKDLGERDFPILLHTQPESFRAIGIYADFGFKLVANDRVGSRVNHLLGATSFLREKLGAKFNRIDVVTLEEQILEALRDEVYPHF